MAIREIAITEEEFTLLKNIKNIVNVSYQTELLKYKDDFNKFFKKLENNGKPEDFEENKIAKKQEGYVNEDVIELKKKVRDLQQQVKQQHDELKRYQQDIDRIEKNVLKRIADAITNSIIKDTKECVTEDNAKKSDVVLTNQPDINNKKNNQDSDFYAIYSDNIYDAKEDKKKKHIDNEKKEQPSIVDENIINEFMIRYNNGYNTKIPLSLPLEVASKRANDIQAKSEEESKAIALSKSDGEAFYFADPVQSKPPYYFVIPDLDGNTFNYKKSLQCGFEDFYNLDSDKDVRGINDGKAVLTRPAIFEKKSNEYYMVEKGILKIY